MKEKTICLWNRDLSPEMMKILQTFCNVLCHLYFLYTDFSCQISVFFWKSTNWNPLKQKELNSASLPGLGICLQVWLDIHVTPLWYPKEPCPHLNVELIPLNKSKRPSIEDHTVMPAQQFKHKCMQKETWVWFSAFIRLGLMPALLKLTLLRTMPHLSRIAQ